MADILLPPVIDAEQVCPPRGGAPVQLTGETMGTDWSLSAIDNRGLGGLTLRTRIEALFARVIAQMSQWDSDSELSRYNRAPSGTWHAIGPQFRIVLDCALQIARASEGAFDPSLGAASERWGFGASTTPTAVPALSGADRPPGWRDIRLDEDGRLWQPGGLRLDLSGIAKGFAVDMVLAALQRMGIAHALLEIGGELAAIGVRSDGQPWWVDIETPPGIKGADARIGLTGWAVATSGSYRRRRAVGGLSWSHLLDPATSAPIDDGPLSVTILHRRAMQADGLATAIATLGHEAGMVFADANGIPARIINADGQCITSAAWLLWCN